MIIAIIIVAAFLAFLAALFVAISCLVATIQFFTHLRPSMLAAQDGDEA